jgi:hypothetical protein
MKRNLILIVILFFTLIVFKGEKPKEIEEFGTVNFLKGKAYYTLPKQEAKLELKKSMLIPLNATIMTDKASRLEIKTRDNHFVRMWENTIISCFSVNIANVKQAKEIKDTKIIIKVKVGKIWNNLLKNSTASRYEVSTPQGVCGVRGTIYNSAVDEKGNTDIMVFDGAVAVTPVTLEIKETFKKTFGKPYRIEKPFHRIEKPYHKVTKEEWESLVKAMQRITISSSGKREVSDFSLEDVKDDEFVNWNTERDKLIKR